MDMRRANEATIRKRFPIPTIGEVLESLDGRGVFSMLDLRWGISQIELDPESRDITALATHDGIHVFLYKRLSFGVNAAPEKYQHIITNKSRFDCYSVRNVPCFETVFQLKQHFLENCQAEISPATDTTFQIGYYAEGNKKFSISSEIQLAEAFSLVKNGKITLWVDPHKDVPRSSLGRKRKG